ncbi:hypothetical protein VKT23_020747 [Stygiomarasmius scandens]|uniref:WW domain-containing protein n=1 Tax=Marasmiellus scandens TaxID=2682957 RepID=A0ABR1IIF5_9AGAR
MNQSQLFTFLTTMTGARELSKNLPTRRWTLITPQSSCVQVTSLIPRPCNPFLPALVRRIRGPLYTQKTTSLGLVHHLGRVLPIPPSLDIFLLLVTLLGPLLRGVLAELLLHPALEHLYTTIVFGHILQFPFLLRSASPSAQVALPIAQTPTPSHASASHVSLANSPVVRDDPPRTRITIRRDTGAPDGGAQGHDIELTTSPVQEGHSAVENLSITRSSLLERELRNEYPHFQPIIPESNSRYDGKATVPADPTEYPIEPLTTYFGRKVPEGWRELLHPEGARYFCYLEKSVYTDANILDDQVLSKIMSFITEIFDFCGMKLPPAAHLVLIPEIGESHSTCAYYCVDHSRRSIFWLDHFTFSHSDFYICHTVKGATDPSHIRHEIESQYWYHCNQYPHSFGLTPILVDELRDIIMHWIDSLTSMTGTAPYSVEDLQSMLSLVNSFRKNTSTGGCVSAYSRLMHIFCRHRFTYFHGQPAVRLDFDRSAHEAPDVPLQSWLLNLLSPLMFSTPDIYYNALDRIWVDRMIHQATWAKFINGMKDEWQELILFGTVLLNANVAFLAIQSIDIGPDGDPQRSPAQIGSYMSVVATLGSIILGLFLARKHRVKPKESAEDAAGFLNTWSPEERGRSEVRIGLETLAILYSVPYALLMWGVILFLGVPGSSPLFSYYGAYSRLLPGISLVRGRASGRASLPSSAGCCLTCARKLGC